MNLERQLVQSYLAGQFSRRQVLRLAAAVGASVPVVALLAACGGDDDDAPAATSTTMTGGGATATTSGGGASTPAATATTSGGAGTPAGTTAATATTSGGGATGSGQPGGELRMSYATVVADTLNQHTSNHTQSRMIARHVLDCLTAVDPSSGEVTPWLAESWEVSDDGLVYTFTLREDVTFHDGDPFNAEAIKANFDYTMDPNTKHAYAYGALGGEKLVSTEVVDDFTVELTYNEPHGTLLPFLSDGATGIDSPAALEEHGEDYGVTALVGSGAYKFVEWVPKDHVTLEPNPNYNWGPAFALHQGPVYLYQLIFQEIAENATRGAALQNGNIQMAMLVESQVSEFDGVEGIEIAFVPKPGTTRMYLFNISKAPLDDIRVRQAINHAIDKETLITLPAWSGIGRPGLAPLPANMVPNGDLSSLEPFDYPYDLDKANALLDEAGWTMGSDGLREKDGQQLILDLVTTTAAINTAEPFDGMINEVGAKLNIIGGDFNFYIETTNRGEYHITLRSDSGFNSAGMIEEYFHSAGVYNTGGMETLEDSAAIDAAIDEALATPDTDVRWENLFEAMELVMKNAVGVMGWEIDYVFGASDTLRDITYNEVGYPHFYDVWIEQ